MPPADATPVDLAGYTIGYVWREPRSNSRRRWRAQDVAGEWRISRRTKRAATAALIREHVDTLHIRLEELLARLEAAELREADREVAA